MAAILKDALRPNLMQTCDHTPVLVHAGPFGNIATGNSSIVADQVGVRCADYLITEAGFGSDMGAERFVNIKCRLSGLQPHAAVVVTTVRAMKLHSGRHRVVAGRPLPEEMLTENPDDVRAGAANLLKHLDIVRSFGLIPVVAVNVFPQDHDSELRAIVDIATDAGARCELATHVVDGGPGAVNLARGGGRSVRRAERGALHLPPRGAAGGQDHRGGPGDLRRRRDRPAARRLPRTRASRTVGIRPPSGRHREDPPVDLLRPPAQGSTHGLDTARA